MIINLFGGPGTGKSTTMAGLFHQLKRDDVDCEQVTEFAKDLVWQESFKVLENQVYIFGKQYHRLRRVADKVNLTITDSPILLNIVYNTVYENSMALKNLDALVLECHDHFDNINIFLRRHKKYNPNGRYQTLDEAKDLDVLIFNMLNDNNIPYIEIDADENAVENILKIIADKLPS